MAGMTENEQNRLIKVYMSVSGGYPAGLDKIGVVASN